MYERRVYENDPLDPTMDILVNYIHLMLHESKVKLSKFIRMHIFKYHQLSKENLSKLQRKKCANRDYGRVRPPWS